MRLGFKKKKKTFKCPVSFIFLISENRCLYLESFWGSLNICVFIKIDKDPKVNFSYPFLIILLFFMKMCLSNCQVFGSKWGKNGISAASLKHYLILLHIFFIARLSQ